MVEIGFGCKCAGATILKAQDFYLQMDFAGDFWVLESVSSNWLLSILPHPSGTP
jgi:hypothetical protein